MKKILTIVTAMLLCCSFTACSAVEALQYSISGDIIDPVDGFSNGAEDGTLTYRNTKYVLVQELNGDCEIDIIKEDILLGQTSNFPFFPNTYYYVETDENPSFIMGGNSAAMIGTFVYLREDLYNAGIVYAINDSFEFEFASAFIKTDKVDYDRHITGAEYTKFATVAFHVKDIPTIFACKDIYLIDGTWYCVEVGAAYQLADEFVRQLTAEGIIS